MNTKTKPMKKLSYLISLIFISVACVERYDVPIRNTKPILVVEGQITSAPPPYYVKLSYTGVFEYGNTIPIEQQENKAKVTIQEEGGRSQALFNVGQGLYRTADGSLRGVVGRLYSISIELPDGTKFVSKPEKLPSTVPVDKISYEFADVPNKEDFRGDPIAPDGYRIFIDFQDPATEQNYYRWAVYGVTRRATTGTPCPYICGSPTGCWCNTSCYVREENNAFNILSDALINGKKISRNYVYFSPLYTTGSHSVEVAQYSLTKEAYQFMKKYQEQQTRTGSLFDPLPAPLEGNVYNEANPNQLALGYFGAMGLYRKRILFNPEDTDNQIFTKLPRYRVNPNTGAYESYNREKGCTDVYEGAYPSGTWPPVGWDTEDLNK